MTTLAKLSRAAALVGVAAFALSACSSTTNESDAQETKTITIADNFGDQQVTVPPRSVVATDNSSFETLSQWGVKLSAAAVSLMPQGLSYTSDSSIVNLGNHIEPNLEAVVAADPDLILNGGRFAQFHDQFRSLVPDATIVELAPRKDQPLDEELKRETSDLGEIFGKQSEAKKLGDDLDKAVARVKAAYRPDTKVMGVIVSGGKIGFVEPGTGRTLGPLFPLLGFTPALEVPNGSTNHQGDDISVEAIAASNPDLILVMDRDAALSTKPEGSKPAKDVISTSEALQNVPAVKSGAVLYMPQDTYLNESIQTYTEYLNAIADQLEASK